MLSQGRVQCSPVTALVSLLSTVSVPSCAVHTVADMYTLAMLLPAYPHNHMRAQVVNPGRFDQCGVDMHNCHSLWCGC
jgi:hypothetical protein